MNANLAAILYLVAGVLFILSLRGLSSPASSRRGNFLGMAGMAIAVATGRGRCVLRARGLRYRHARPHPRRKPG